MSKQFTSNLNFALNLKNRYPKNSHIVYGKHSVFAALQNPQRKIFAILSTQEKLSELQFFIQQKQLYNLFESFIKITSNKELNNLITKEDSPNTSSSINHQGLAIICQPLSQPILEDFLPTIQNNPNSTIIILDQANDPRNIGSIIRTALGFSVDCIIKPKNNSPDETSSMVKMASGSFEKMPLISVTNIKNTIDFLKKKGYWIYGLSPTSSTFIHQTNLFNQKTAFILGNEEKGLRQLTSKNIDFMLKIPMDNHLESFNLSIAASIILYENYKQKYLN